MNTYFLQVTENKNLLLNRSPVRVELEEFKLVSTCLNIFRGIQAGFDMYKQFQRNSSCSFDIFKQF